jgi:hypothetical protein
MFVTASGQTAQNLIDRARVFLDETTAVRWSDTQLLRFLNDGLIDLCAKSLCYQGTESVALVANTFEYTPTTSYIAVVHVVCNPASGTGWGLIKSNVRSRGTVGQEFDVPKYWYEFGGKVGIFPAYASVTTQTATVYFAKQPAVLVLATAVPTPAIFDKALVYYIASQGYLMDHRPAEAGNYMALYAQELDRFRQDFVGSDDKSTDPVR